MKKLGVMSAITVVLFIMPCLAQAQVNINISIPLPPPIVFSAPPELVILPETEVYVAPDYDQDLYFYQGFWWRFWLGRWYRSLYYDSGWEFYRGVPIWYAGVYPRWRENYRNHIWGGHRWDYRPVHYNDVRTNWKTWHDTGRYQQHWGTSGSYHPGAEDRRDFRGFDQGTKYRQGPSAPRQSFVGAKDQHSPVASRTFDLSKNRNSFAGVGPGNDARIQSKRGFQSRQSMSSKQVSGASKANAGHGNVSRPR